MDKRYLTKDYCDKECFANRDNRCMALSVSIKKDCPFRRSDITMEQQNKAVMRYSSTKLWDR